MLRQKSPTPTSASSGGRTGTPSTSSVNDATSSNGPIPEVVTLQEFINYSSPVNNVCVLHVLPLPLINGSVGNVCGVIL